MYKLLLTLVALSSGVLCNVAQNRTDTVTRSLDPIDVVNNNENVHSGSADEQIHNVTKRCLKGDLQRSDYTYTPGIGYHKLHTRKVNWAKARKSCMAESGLLAIINSAGEAAILANWMRRENIGETWLGTHDQYDEGEWLTLKGDTLEKAGYDKWLPNQPDNFNGNENCGSLRYDGMNDLPCTEAVAYFCKIYKC